MKNFILTLTASFFSVGIFSQNIDSAQFYFKKGLDEKNSRLYAVAAKDFDKAIAFNQKYSEAYIENGNVNLEMRKIDASVVNFTKAHQLEPSNNEVIKQLANLYLNNRQFQKAIDLAQKCGSCENGDRILGMSYYNLEDYGKAETFLQKAIKKNNKDAEAAYTLGRTFIELENEKAAIAQYQAAVTLEPARNMWMYELGLIYYNQEDYKNALKYFNMAGDAGYNKANDYYENVGFAQLYTGDTENGVKTLNAVLDKKPNNKELINNIAYAMYSTKKYDDALAYYQKLLELNPKDASSLFMAGMVFQKKGEKEKGQKICDKAIEMDPSLARKRQKKEMPTGL
ncbi:MAG: tetratricopeptide repeat protein [Bacteroidota bacterium]|nr:tetratricopeptide repeat protein [Bacteroidota bacterium]